MTDSLLTTDTLLTFVVAALASYRVARMFATVTGPFALFARMRRHIDPDQKTWIGIGLNCPYCHGLWASLASYGLLTYSQNSIVHFVIYVLAVAGIQTIIQSWEPVPTHIPHR
jgi:hypothetical protein